MKIEVAKNSDISALCDLLEILFCQEAEFKPDREAQIRGLETIINDDNVGHILLVRQHDKVIAMVTLLYTISTAIGSRVAILEDMVVSSDVRGAGIGSKLLEQAIAFAKAGGCQRITLLTDEDNRAAHHFYQNNGFHHSSMIVFRKQLGG